MNITKKLTLATSAMLGLTAFAAPKPNIIIMLVDDMGYSDLGCYGGEILTPNIDKLAQNGLRYTQCYNTARSCPSRASLMTGQHPHQAGIGWMTANHQGYDGYIGELSKNTVTIAEVLKTVGYSTYMSGKWHLTRVEDQSQNGSKHNWPIQRGFDRYWGTIAGSGSFWDPKFLKNDNDSTNAANYKDFFYTDKTAEQMSSFITDHVKQKKGEPFFGYVAFTAPHWPMHAREKTINKYINRYSEGWDELRIERYNRMVEMGIVNPDWKLSDRDSDAKAWDEVSDEEKRIMIKRMAVYAAMVDEMDQAVGNIVSTLKETKQFDNTLILFLSDNGACAEYITQKDNSYEALGTSASFESYRLPWANASNTPFRMFKHWVHEGGISTPLIAHWPKGIKAKGEFRNQPHYLIDFMATCVDLSGAKYPSEFKGNSIPEMEGISIAKSFDNSPQEERYMFWEHESNCAARKGKWKIVYRANYEWPFANPWELYDLEVDRTETNNLASKYPEIVKEMAEAWDKWAETHKVYPLDGRRHGVRVKNPIYNFPPDAKMPK